MKYISILMLWLTVFPLFSQELIVIHPTGEENNDYPVMVAYEDSSRVAVQSSEIIKNTIVGEFIEIHDFLQHYLVKTGKQEAVEKAYLGLTKNQGGFAKQGFYLKSGERLIDKSQVFYVDIVEGQFNRNLGKLMSITQLYPHELGHALYRLSADKSDSANNSFSTHMHYVSLLTDPAIAFNEGFAEHIENISRYEEKNDTLKIQIFNDLDRIIPRWHHAFIGFQRDFNFPYRYGYYKATMLFWYQQYEDWKRFAHIADSSIIYQSNDLGKGSLEDRMTYMNTGVSIDKTNLRNYSELFLSEGVINRFFTLLTRSGLSKNYREKEFYLPFFRDSLDQLPERLISPIQNQFLKYFVVFDNYLDVNYSSSTQLSDFIEGYCKEFPDECEELHSIFQEATGHEFKGSPPLLWMMARDHDHRLLVFDAFDGLTEPFYTFELNSASKVDLLTLSLEEEDAEKIIQYRENSGWFNSLDQVVQVPGLSSEAIEIINKSQLDIEYYESMSSPELTLNSLIVAPIVSLFIKTLYASIIIIVVLWVFVFRKENYSFPLLIVKFIRIWLLVVGFMLLGLASIILTQYAIWILSSIALLALLLTYFIYRKNVLILKQKILSLGIICFYTIISMI